MRLKAISGIDRAWQVAKTMSYSKPAEMRDRLRALAGDHHGHLGSRLDCTYPVACRVRENLIGCATLSHMEIGVRELRNRTSQVIDAVRAGERVVLTVHGEAVADIVPHGRRTRWLQGDHLRRELVERAADPALRHDLDALAGQTLDEL